jgi:hypothetical protein
MKADVYRNLGSEVDEEWSIRSRETDDYGSVRDYADGLVMRDVSFVVQPSGREQARKDEQRNIHAFARGIVLCSASGMNLSHSDHWIPVSYHYRPGHFFVADEEDLKVIAAPAVAFLPSGKCYAYQPTTQRLEPA